MKDGKFKKWMKEHKEEILMGAISTTAAGVLGYGIWASHKAGYIEGLMRGGNMIFDRDGEKIVRNIPREIAMEYKDKPFDMYSYLAPLDGSDPVHMSELGEQVAKFIEEDSSENAADSIVKAVYIFH